MSKAGNWTHNSRCELQETTTFIHRMKPCFMRCIYFHMPGCIFPAWLLLLWPSGPSVSRSRTLCLRPTHWLTRGYELLKVSLTTHGMSAEFPSAEDTYDLMCVSGSARFDLSVSSFHSSMWWVDGVASTGPLPRRQPLRTLGSLQWQVIIYSALH